MRDSINFPCIKIEQPIGTFFVGSISAKDLCDITYTDVRRIEGEKGFDAYLGIQRPLSINRVRELQAYVKSADACFPTAVILAVPAECVEFDEKTCRMTLSSFEDLEDLNRNISFDHIGKVIDGQHRIEGLRGSEIANFQVNVSIFVDMDIADQAYLFSTVNLAQTKVNKSLVYDLFELAKSRSPQKVCHDIAVMFDNNSKSPFFERVKRLGTSTEGRFLETITQATFVEALMKFISKNPLEDRNIYIKGKTPKKASSEESKKLIFRNMFIDKKEFEITDNIWNFFSAVKKRWPDAWDFMGKGLILNKTNGFKALMRFFGKCYLQERSNIDAVIGEDAFLKILKKIDLSDNDFNTDNFKPGTSGEAKLYSILCEKAGL